MLRWNSVASVLCRIPKLASAPLLESRCTYLRTSIIDEAYNCHSIINKNSRHNTTIKEQNMLYIYTHFSAKQLSQNNSNDSNKFAQDNYAFFSLYRRLRKSGEERKMIERSLSVYPLKQSINFGLTLLRYHRKLTDINVKLLAVKRYHFVKRLKLSLLCRYYALRLFILRLKLHSLNALSDLLTYSLFLVICVLLYEIYHICRVGVSRAEERYRTLSIPVVQTFMALESGHEQRRKLREELEEDIRRDRESSIVIW